MKKIRISNPKKECDSLKCQIKDLEGKLPEVKLRPRTIILCPYVEKQQINPFTCKEETLYHLSKLNDTIHTCPAIRCLNRRGVYCLSDKQLEQIKKQEEKTKQ